MEFICPLPTSFLLLGASASVATIAVADNQEGFLDPCLGGVLHGPAGRLTPLNLGL
jgi:hypothetical protein